ncbi:olfactory receptor 4S2-like [Ambystoma mexicanum]|uniref:olfactory receptor 4S2-like n=1 Tax=Ambystoma mexicanum TaxID=8296 RepID=UPI0037E94B62
MEMFQGNNVTEFVFLGLSQISELQTFFLLLFSGMYAVILVGNILTIITVNVDNRLDTPMYFFLSHLSFIDLCYSSVTAPKMLADLVTETKTISFNACIMQKFFLHFIGGTEMLLLTVMAFDRYVAICKPLHYMTIMSHRTCGLLVAASWVGGSIHSLVQTLLLVRLPFCGPNVIDSFFCDGPQLLNLACADTTLTGFLILSNGGLIAVCSFSVLVTSYVLIIQTLRNQLTEGKRRALSTCGSHCIVVTFFFGPCIYIYLRPSTSLPMDKVVSVFYTLITPMLNPIVYTLRNGEMKRAMIKLGTRYIFPARK